MTKWHFFEYARNDPINAHIDVSSGAKGLNFCLSHHLHPYAVYASSEGSSERAHLRRLA